MFKLFVFVALLAIAHAIPLKEDYFKDINELFEVKNDSSVCDEELIKFKECFKDVAEKANEFSEFSYLPSQLEVFGSVEEIKEALTCTGEVTCNKLILSKYIIETAVYAVEHIYGEGYKCLDDEKSLQMTLLRCLVSTTPVEELQTGNFDAIVTNVKPIARCVANEQKCDAPQKTEFFKGAMAFAELTEVSMEVARAVQSGDKTFINEFEKKFDSAVFDNLEL